jgi:hypothetical protein
MTPSPPVPSRAKAAQAAERRNCDALAASRLRMAALLPRARAASMGRDVRPHVGSTEVGVAIGAAAHVADGLAAHVPPMDPGMPEIQPVPPTQPDVPQPGTEVPQPEPGLPPEVPSPAPSPADPVPPRPPEVAPDTDPGPTSRR